MDDSEQSEESRTITYVGANLNYCSISYVLIENDYRYLEINPVYTREQFFKRKKDGPA